MPHANAIWKTTTLKLEITVVSRVLAEKSVSTEISNRRLMCLRLNRTLDCHTHSQHLCFLIRSVRLYLAFYLPLALRTSASLYPAVHRRTRSLSSFLLLLCRFQFILDSECEATLWQRYFNRSATKVLFSRNACLCHWRRAREKESDTQNVLNGKMRALALCMVVFMWVVAVACRITLLDLLNSTKRYDFCRTYIHEQTKQCVYFTCL